MSEVQLIPNQQLLEVVANKGLEKQEEQTIQLSYQPYFEQMAEIKESAKKINFENPTELDEKIARELRLKTVKIRTGSQSIKDERKRIHSLKANLEQDAWNLIKSMCELEEEQFFQIEKKRENAEKLRKENLRIERLSILSEVCDNASIYPLSEMGEDAFIDLFNGLKLAKEAKIESERKAEAERIEAERLEAERIEKQRIENEKLKAEAEERERQIESERKKQRQEAERVAKIEAEKLVKVKAEAEAKLKAEQESKAKLEAELKAKKDAELKAENDRIEAEKKAKLETEKLAKAPIKKQLNVWVDSFEINPLSTQHELADSIFAKFESFKKWAKSEIEKL